MFLGCSRSKSISYISTGIYERVRAQHLDVRQHLHKAFSALPTGYAFDQYGLIVPAGQLQPDAHVNDQSPTTSPQLDHIAEDSPLSSPGNTPAQSPTSDTFTSSCVPNECQPTVMYPSQASAETTTIVEPDAVRASGTSERLRSCPKLSYASGQQQFRWDHRKGRPIEQLFRRMGNPTRSVSVQKPSLSLQQPSFESMPLSNVQAVFAKNVTSDDPLNVLDLRNPLPRSVLPYFLTGEDCQLLSRVRDVLLEGASAERCTAPITEWNKWKDDEDWVLLTQGGAFTLTHQDSCGKATWLTVQEGQLGFGWMSHPSKEETRGWSADPNGFTGGQLRYVVLHPGQTIYFEAGTIHFVFRLEQYQTLLIEIVLNQLRFPNATNEDLLPSAPAYVEAVTQLVSEQQSLGSSDELGSEKAIHASR
ncbi:hypothetical protein CC80DRAFT_571449 [Byssothecium circinans]|uniref:JmjC domain-containing protein n=1 Tax=Byssothecium circinans TaxID=147558 RepID=A0A6A5TUZ3_9PLEO|nr:hypothetical protein CC80DRAFT_571449 [Byssothecium circinans]